MADEREPDEGTQETVAHEVPSEDAGAQETVAREVPSQGAPEDSAPDDTAPQETVARETVPEAGVPATGAVALGSAGVPSGDAPSTTPPPAPPQPPALEERTGQVESRGTSPAEADRVAADQTDAFAERPELYVAGAFVGAFLLAKILKRLGGGDG